MKFINHAEGYLEPAGGGIFRYVFQYKDIWKNVRLSDSDLNGNGSINPATEILHERNYYPFGMEHRGYNATLVGAKNNLKTFQQQEFTEDFGLNTHEWKFRISDPSTGRFWQIDPLAADYPYNSTFAFQENKLGMGVELEGLELFPINPVDMFNFEGGGKPVLTFGLHNIVLPTAERNESGGAGAFVENVAKSAWNGIAATWNEGMSGKDMGQIVDEGMAAMGDMARRIESGEGTLEDAENITAAVGLTVVTGGKGKVKETGLGNPFKDKTLKQVNKAMEKHVNSGKLEVKHINKNSGSISYKNKKSGYSYNVDTGKQKSSGYKKAESAHVDVNYPNPKPKNVPDKKKLPIKD